MGFTATSFFYFKFVGYSNAGWGGNVNFQIGVTAQPIPLIGWLSHNPNPGGTWYDLDNSGRLNANGEFNAVGITSAVSYRFMYVDQQPNYPPDSAWLTLNFSFPSNLADSYHGELSPLPNPSQGTFSLNLPERLIGETIEIYSFDLKKVDEFRVEKGRLYSIEKPGLYFIKVGRINKMNKLIIQK